VWISGSGWNGCLWNLPSKRRILISSAAVIYCGVLVFHLFILQRGFIKSPLSPFNIPSQVGGACNLASGVAHHLVQYCINNPNRNTQGCYHNVILCDNGEKGKWYITLRLLETLILTHEPRVGYYVALGLTEEWCLVPCCLGYKVNRILCVLVDFLPFGGTIGTNTSIMRGCFVHWIGHFFL